MRIPQAFTHHLKSQNILNPNILLRAFPDLFKNTSDEEMQGCEKKEHEGEQEGKVYSGGQEVGASTLQSEKGLRFQIYMMCCYKGVILI